jgi:hypothetical protein
LSSVCETVSSLFPLKESIELFELLTVKLCRNLGAILETETSETDLVVVVLQLLALKLLFIFCDFLSSDAWLFEFCSFCVNLPIILNLYEYYLINLYLRFSLLINLEKS